jgi:hypothetical protein
MHVGGDADPRSYCRASSYPGLDVATTGSVLAEPAAAGRRVDPGGSAGAIVI